MPRPRTVSDEVILRAAAEAIAKIGPDGLTLRAIAELAGLSPSGLVQRFGSKRELLLALAAMAPDALRKRIENAQSPNEAPLERLVELLIGESAGFAATPQAAANHLAFLQLDLKDTEFRHHAVDHLQTLEDGIRTLLSEAVRTGDLEDTDSERLARTVLLTYSGSMIRWAIRREEPLEVAMRRDVSAVLDPYRP